MNRSPVRKSPEIQPGDLCRATIHDDPAVVAERMADWFRDPDLCAAAAGWLTDLADRIGELGR